MYKRQVQGGDCPTSAWGVVESVKNYIHGHYMEDLSRQDIEAAVHLNGDYLNRIFKKATGYSLVQYIQLSLIHICNWFLAHQPENSGRRRGKCG